MIVFTLAAVSLKGVNRERELAEPVLELQKLAKKASRSAATQRNRFVLRMLPRNVTAYQTGAKGKVVEISKVRFSPEVRFLIRVKETAPELNRNKLIADINDFFINEMKFITVNLVE